MTDDELDAIELRALAATREPWHVEYLGEHGYPQRIANDAAVLVATTYEGHQPAGNAEFIAAARSDVPALVAEVRRLREQLANHDPMPGFPCDNPHCPCRANLPAPNPGAHQQ